MSWDEKDWATTNVFGKTENVEGAIKELNMHDILYGRLTSNVTKNGMSHLRFYAYDKYVTQLEIKEENIYNEIAIRYDVFIEYEYLSHYLAFPKHSFKEKFNERREWLLNK